MERTDTKQVEDVLVGRKDYETMMLDVLWGPDAALLIPEGRLFSRARHRLPKQNVCGPCRARNKGNWITFLFLETKYYKYTGEHTKKQYNKLLIFIVREGQ